jgi:hypothetical protein
MAGRAGSTWWFHLPSSPEHQPEGQPASEPRCSVPRRCGAGRDGEDRDQATDEALSNYKGTATADYIRHALGRWSTRPLGSIRTFQEDQNEFEQRMTDLAKNTLPPGPGGTPRLNRSRALIPSASSRLSPPAIWSQGLAGLPANASSPWRSCLRP